MISESIISFSSVSTSSTHTAEMRVKDRMRMIFCHEETVSRTLISGSSDIMCQQLTFLFKQTMPKKEEEQVEATPTVLTSLESSSREILVGLEAEIRAGMMTHFIRDDVRLSDARVAVIPGGNAKFVVGLRSNSSRGGIILESNATVARHTDDPNHPRSSVQIVFEQNSLPYLPKECQIRHCRCHTSTAKGAVDSVVLLLQSGADASTQAVARVVFPTTRHQTTADYTIHVDVQNQIMRLLDAEGDDVGRDAQWAAATSSSNNNNNNNKNNEPQQTFVLSVVLSGPGHWVQLI
eukprot:PhM_4_TR14384/c0_g1_i1/m.60991